MERAMERVPEPELMEEEAQARAYAEADFSEPHGRFVELLLARLPDLPSSGSALDLGCGPADVTLRVARALPGWTVDGLDGSAAMLHYGVRAVVRAGLAGRVALKRIRLPDDPAPRPRYELVFSNSLLHHLADPAVLWRSLLRCVDAPGRVFVMDLLRPASREEATGLVDRHAAGEPEILRRDFLSSLLAAYRIEEVRDQLARAGLEHLSSEIVGDRHFIVWGRLGETAA
jgi:SAM-dependent methyltransferase